MQAVRFLLSSSGRLRPRPFVLGAAAVYLAGMASHALTVPDVISRAGFWPFIIAQALLVWVWFALHAKRLRDAGRPAGLAAGVSVLYALSIMLLLIVADAFFNTSAGAATDANTTSVLGLLLLLSIVATLLGSPNYDLAWLVVAMLTMMGLVPVVVALAVTVWAARRPGVEEQTA